MNKILLAIDGSACSTAAVDLLNQLPLPSKCHLTVLTVLEDVRSLLFDTKIDGDVPECFDGADLDGFEAQRNKDAASLLDSAAQRLGRPGWTTNTVIRQDEAANGIIEAASEIGADLIVIGSHGFGQVKRFLIGSVSQKVVAYAPCSVLVARQPKESVPEPPLRVLVALDGSAPSQAALGAVAQMAKRGSVRATIVRVLGLSRFYRMDILERMTDSWRNQKQAAEKQLQAAGETLRQTGAEVSVNLRDGHDISEEILTLADQNDTDIIFIGHKGCSGIKRFLLGSVSRRVVCYAGCSVWVHRDRQT